MHEYGREIDRGVDQRAVYMETQINELFGLSIA